MLEFLGVTITSPTPIYEDNQAVLFLTEAVKVHPRTKHINKILNFIREFIQEDVISLIKVHTSLNVADIMTKRTLMLSNFCFSDYYYSGTKS
jgi:predicted ATP-grasp superfamily ATP-dependent carboligase